MHEPVYLFENHIKGAKFFCTTILQGFADHLSRGETKNR